MTFIKHSVLVALMLAAGTAPASADSIRPAASCPGVAPCKNRPVSVKVPVGQGYSWACVNLESNWVGAYHKWVIHTGLNPVDARGVVFWGRQWIGQGGSGRFPYYDLKQYAVVQCDG